MSTQTERGTIPAALCTIGVVRDLHGTPTKLRIFPVTPGYPVIYYPCDGASVSPELPQQVEWSVRELVENEAVTIQKKSNAPHAFEGDSKPFVLTALRSRVRSGFPLEPGGNGRPTIAWVYSIEMTSPVLTKPLLLDPVIIIEPDPK